MNYPYRISSSSSHSTPCLPDITLTPMSCGVQTRSVRIHLGLEWRQTARPRAHLRSSSHLISYLALARIDIHLISSHILSGCASNLRNHAGLQPRPDRVSYQHIPGRVQCQNRFQPHLGRVSFHHNSRPCHGSQATVLVAEDDVARSGTEPHPTIVQPRRRDVNGVRIGHDGDAIRT